MLAGLPANAKRGIPSPATTPAPTQPPSSQPRPPSAPSTIPSVASPTAAHAPSNSTMIALMCTTQYPASTPAVQAVLHRKDLTEEQRAEAIRKIHAEHTPK